MRILQVNKYLYRRGGAESYLADVADLLGRAGHEVALFGMQHPANPPLPYQQSFPSAVELEPAPEGLAGKARAAGRMFWSSSARRGIASVLRQFKPDVVHFHNVYHHLSPSIFGPVAAAGIPSVMTLHDYKLACPTYQMLDNGRVCDACVGRHFHQAVLRGCRNNSRTESGLMAAELAVHIWTGRYGPVSRFLCPSRFLLDTMQRGRVYPDRLRLLPNFVDATAIEPKSAPGGPMVFAGRISFEKGIDTFIDAVARVPGVQGVIAGEGPDRAELERRAAEVAPGRVRFTGRLERDAVLDLVRSATAVILPARWNENQPMAILEAFALGVPAVTTTLGGLPELVDPGRTGLLVAPDDAEGLAGAISSLAHDPATAFAMGGRARAYVLDRHDPDRHLRDLVDHYREVSV